MMSLRKILENLDLPKVDMSLFADDQFADNGILSSR